MVIVYKDHRRSSVKHYNKSIELGSSVNPKLLELLKHYHQRYDICHSGQEKGEFRFS